MPTRMVCETCAYKWSRPDSEPIDRPCPKCQQPVKLKKSLRKSTTEWIQAEQAYNPTLKSDAMYSDSKDSSTIRPRRTRTEVLTVDDSSRFRAVVEEAAERLELLGLVTSATSKKLAKKREGEDGGSVGNRKDIFSLMLQQKELEQKFEQLMHKRWTLKGLSNKSKYLQNQAELKELAEQLRESSANISQNLKDHPTIVGNLNKIQKDRSGVQDLLVHTMEDLKYQSFDTLVDQVAIRTEQQRLLADTQRRQEQTAQALKTLQGKLDEECEIFDKEVEERNREIKDKAEQLKHLKKVTALRMEYEQNTARAEAEMRARGRKYALDDMHERIDTCNTNIAKDTFVSEKTTGFLKSQLHDLELLAAEWDSKYKTDLDQKQNELETLSEQREADLVILNGFRGRWDEDQAEKKALKEEAEQRERESKARRRLLRVMELAQCKIRFWYKVHQRHAGKKKKKKKGGKKKAK